MDGEEFLLVHNGRVLAAFLSDVEAVLFQAWMDEALGQTAQANATISRILMGN